VRRPYIGDMTMLNLTDNNRADLARFLVDRYPLSPGCGGSRRCWRRSICRPRRPGR